MINETVVTSYGILSPLGENPITFFNNLLIGKNTLTKTPRIQTTGMPQEKGFFLQQKELNENPANADKEMLLSIIPKNIINKNASKICLINATTMAAGIHGQNQIKNTHINKNYNSTWEEAINCVSSTTAEYIANKLGIKAYSTISNACSSGTAALGIAKQYIEQQKYNQVIVTTTNILHEIPFYGFSALRLMSKDTCRPFDQNRNGLLLGESIAYICLESLSSAKKNNKEIHGKISGFGASSDATHITRPDLKGVQAANAIKKALFDAKLKNDEIDYINAHGTGTKANDLAETNAIKTVFDKITPISSIKAVTGHTLGSAGIIEAIACIETLKKNILPPTHNYQSKDIKCDLDYIPNEPREKICNHIMSTSFGFGGNNAALILEKIK